MCILHVCSIIRVSAVTHHRKDRRSSRENKQMQRPDHLDAGTRAHKMEIYSYKDNCVWLTGNFVGYVGQVRAGCHLILVEHDARIIASHSALFT